MTKSSLLLALGAGVALSHLAAPLVAAPVFLEAAWKAAGVLLFAAYALRRGAPLAGLALALSSAGDVMLALAPPRWIAGMAAFALAHLFYIAAFAGLARRSAIDRRTAPLALVALAASSGMAVWLLPDMDALAAPGLAYQAVITAMVMAALASPAPRLAKAGAVLFMLSDALIALELYKDVPPPPGAVWLSYVAAQMMLAKGFAEARDGRASGISRT
ncbi:MAG: lysoplasmalogenase [Amphiplicatus sp.]